jgi:hypothetical protein
MKEIVSDPSLVARCGLYCGACRAYLKGKCGGCSENHKATWCKIRTCCDDNRYTTCADCTEFENPNDCKKFNNFIGTIFGIIFRSNRAGCIQKIREIGPAQYADVMARDKLQSVKR